MRPPLANGQRKPKGYAGRFLAIVQLCNEARRAAKHEDSIFIWIPKNAGTSVYNMLSQNGLVALGNPGSLRVAFRNKGRVSFGHMKIGSLIESGMVSRDFFDRAFKFAFSRDPYARAVSLYHYLFGTVMADWHRKPSFEEFLQLIADGFYDPVGPYIYRGLSQCNPQVEWLRDAWPDKIYRVEDMDAFVADISERWGIKAGEVPHLNRSGPAQPTELSREEQALIERIYSEDFDTLGYSKRR